MEKVILYGSNYGTAKRYADELSKRTGIKALAYNEVSSLSCYDTILYFGGLYAGGVLGLKQTVNRFPITENQALIIVTVGLADPKDQTNIDNIKNSISNQMPKYIYEKCKIFHLRGGIDYQNINLKHKMMMKLLYKKTKNLPPEKQNAETKAFIDTYNKKVDFVDFDSLNDIIAVL